METAVAETAVAETAVAETAVAETAVAETAKGSAAPATLFHRDSCERQEDGVPKSEVGTGDLFVIRFFCPSSALSKDSATISRLFAIRSILESLERLRFSDRARRHLSMSRTRPHQDRPVTWLGKPTAHPVEGLSRAYTLQGVWYHQIAVSENKVPSSRGGFGSMDIIQVALSGPSRGVSV